MISVFTAVVYSYYLVTDRVYCQGKAEIPREQLPCDIFVTCHEEIGRVGEYATTKLLPWNLSLIKAVGI